MERKCNSSGRGEKVNTEIKCIRVSQTHQLSGTDLNTFNPYENMNNPKRRQAITFKKKNTNKLVMRPQIVLPALKRLKQKGQKFKVRQACGLCP